MSQTLSNLAAVRKGIADHMAKTIKYAHVRQHGGPINMEELRVVSTRTPAILVACLGLPKFERKGTLLVGQAVYACFVAARDEVKAKRDVMSMIVTEAIASETVDNFWGDTALGAPTDLAGSNLFSRGLDEEGISLWVLRWRQQVEMRRNTVATLDDFITFFATYDIGETDDTEPTEDQTTLEVA